TAQHDEGELGVEVAMLVGHVGANDALADDGHALDDAHLLLKKPFAFVPCRQCLVVHVRPSRSGRARGQARSDRIQAAARPTGVRTKSTKPGSASTRRRKAPTAG